MVSSLRGRVALALATVYVVWSSTYLALRWVVAELPPLTSTALRFLAAGLVLLVGLRLRRGAAPSLRTLAIGAPLGVLVFGVGNGFVGLAQRSVPSGTAAVACAAMPCFAGAFEALSGKHVPRRELVGIALGLAGIVVLEGGALWGGLGAAAWLLVFAPMGWALGSMLSRRWLAADPLGAAAGQMIGGGLAALVAARAFGETLPAHVSMRAGLAWVYLVVFGSLVAFSAYAWLLHHVSVGVATSYAFVNPVLALLLGAFVGGEAIAPTIWPAIALVLAGLVLLLGGRAREASSAPVTPREPVLALATPLPGSRPG